MNNLPICVHYQHNDKGNGTCDLMPPPYGGNTFLKIRNAFNQRYHQISPERHMVPNGECFWDNMFSDCPCFESKF